MDDYVARLITSVDEDFSEEVATKDMVLSEHANNINDDSLRETEEAINQKWEEEEPLKKSTSNEEEKINQSVEMVIRKRNGVERNALQQSRNNQMINKKKKHMKPSISRHPKMNHCPKITITPYHFLKQVLESILQQSAPLE